MSKLLKERLLTLQHVPVRFTKKCARTRRAGAEDREQAGQQVRIDYWHGTTADMQLQLQLHIRHGVATNWNPQDQT